MVGGQLKEMDVWLGERGYYRNTSVPLIHPTYKLYVCFVCNKSLSPEIGASMYNLPSINVNPREWIKVNIYRGVNN